MQIKGFRGPKAVILKGQCEVQMHLAAHPRLEADCHLILRPSIPTADLRNLVGADHQKGLTSGSWAARAEPKYGE